MSVVQVHNWGQRFDDGSPNLEFVAPSSVYVVVNGETTHIDLHAIPVSGGQGACGATGAIEWRAPKEDPQQTLNYGH